MSDAARQIHNLIYSYAEAVDTANFERLGELFAHGGFRHSLYDDVDDPTCGRRAQDAAAFFRDLVLIHEDGTPRTRHVTTNVQIDIDEEGRVAHASSYVHTLQPINGSIQIIAAGRYVDRFECVDRVWRFADRLGYRDWEGDMSHHGRASAWRSVNR